MKKSKFLKMYLGIFLTFAFLQLRGEGEIQCDLVGQLGNQCFEIAATLSVAWDHDAAALFPDLKLNPKYNIPKNAEKVFWRLEAPLRIPQNGPIYTEPHFQFAPIPYQPNLRLKGFFQSEKYFKKYQDKIIALFSPSEDILTYLHNTYAYIIEDPKTVSIHIRNYTREYLNPPIHPFIGRAYVQKAITRFPKDSHFIVFSDDIPWCKSNLSGLAKNMTFIEGEAHYHDFYLMSLCQHNIITNSSFSWWAAYLNPNPNKVVIAPLLWFKPEYGINCKDLIPVGWKRM